MVRDQDSGTEGSKDEATSREDKVQVSLLLSEINLLHVNTEQVEPKSCASVMGV